MKLLFICNNLHIGGIQKSLINLFSEISDSYDITLFVFADIGDLSVEVPKNVKIISGNRFTKILGLSQNEAESEGFFTALWRSIWVIITKVIGIGFSFGILTRMQKLKESYDVAISFSQNSAYKMFYGGCNEFAINSVKAKKKISFVHCDFEHYFGNNPYNRKFYSNFDAIACVSDSCKKVFEGVCPEYSDKTATVHNCYNFEKMRSDGDAFSADYTENVLNIFTAARISEEKGIFRMFPIFKMLKELGFKFVWRIAGSGPLLEKAKEDCEKHGITENVVFLGMLDNPYPYFKSSDLLLVPSYDDAAPMVFFEAAYFGLPIFTTNTTSANELVKEKGIGFVSENNDEAILKGLYGLMENQDKVLKSVEKIKISNEQAVEEFNNLIVSEKNL